MKQFESEIQTIPHSEKEVFDVLSDLSKVDLIKDQIPGDKVSDLTYDQDSCTLTVPPIGKVRLVVEERVPNSYIKFKAEQLPFKLNLTVTLDPSSNESTKLQLKAEADLNVFLKPMVSKPLQKGIEKAAEILATVPYDELSKNKKFEGFK